MTVAKSVLQDSDETPDTDTAFDLMTPAVAFRKLPMPSMVVPVCCARSLNFSNCGRTMELPLSCPVVSFAARSTTIVLFANAGFADQQRDLADG
ncbi:hypothetical protein A6A25_37335 [Saccharothrix sp. CB00851]|nr:hypothetical protein A6A25_37335 [Saccharothrix sp. CB00851]